MYYAVRRGRSSFVQLLLQHGADANTEVPYNSSYESLLMVACRYGQEEIATLLLENGANSEYKRKRDGATPAVEVIKYGRQSMLHIFFPKKNLSNSSEVNPNLNER